jgi:hypothetical protein
VLRVVPHVRGALACVQYDKVAGLPVCRFDKLAGFVGDAFKDGAAERIDEIIAALEDAIVRPIPTGRPG